MCGICGCFRSACGCCCQNRTKANIILNVEPSDITAGELLRGNIDNISRNIPTTRNVSIQITNFTDRCTLSKPRVHLNSGYCLNPPQPTVAKKTSEVCSFTKTSYSFYGCSGVLVYEILKDKKHFAGELAIMFSVPFSYWQYNYIGIGIYEKHISCNKELFHEMYYDGGSFTRGKATGSEMEYSGVGICVKGTMSSAGTAIVKVEFRDSRSSKA